MCGEVKGRNSAGKGSISPFVGVLMGPDPDADFVLVAIGCPHRERAEVIQLCRASGIYGVDVGRGRGSSSLASSGSMKRRWCNEKGPHRERHEEVTLRRIALGIAKAKLLPARDVAYLVRLGLVDESDGRLKSPPRLVGSVMRICHARRSW